MSVAATLVFEFLERQDTCTHERFEVSSPAFGELRQSMRRMVLMLRDTTDQEAQDQAVRLRALLSEWLTAPVPFDRPTLSLLAGILGEAGAVGMRWGGDVLALYQSALGAIQKMNAVKSPLCEQLRLVIDGCIKSNQSFKIFCHRRARPFFNLLFTSSESVHLSDDVFLHTVRDYRLSEPFDVLVKVGPLRSRGWGAAPDAILSAPRFAILYQVVWSGCGDEPDFGYDPATVSRNAETDDGSNTVGDRASYRGPAKWRTCIVRCGDTSGVIEAGTVEVDELREFSRTERSNEKRSAVLVQIDTEHGILYPPYSRVLSIDPAAKGRQLIDFRVPGESLNEGMFVVRPLLGEVDLGGVQAEHGHYSRIWKEKLAEALASDAAELVRRLRKEGLQLVHLEQALRHWLRPATTVIHAPQQVRHFEVLLKALGIIDGAMATQRHRQLSFGQRAWNEIRRSRGEAIQAGVQEHEIIEQQLLLILHSLEPEILSHVNDSAPFQLDIPAQYGIGGQFLFCKILGVEEGFSAPEGEIRVIRQLQLIDQWRD